MKEENRKKEEEQERWRRRKKNKITSCVKLQRNESINSETTVVYKLMIIFLLKNEILVYYG